MWCSFDYINLSGMWLRYVGVGLSLEWQYVYALWLAKQVKHQIVIFWNSCMCSVGCASIFIMQKMFSMVEVNTKVVNNYIILLVLKSHDSRPDGLDEIIKCSVMFCM
jgi:hypothetical protein